MPTVYVQQQSTGQGWFGLGSAGLDACDFTKHQVQSFGDCFYVILNNCDARVELDMPNTNCTVNVSVTDTAHKYHISNSYIQEYSLTNTALKLLLCPHKTLHVELTLHKDGEIQFND